jgi:hypothetical protein
MVVAGMKYFHVLALAADLAVVLEGWAEWVTIAYNRAS